MVNYATKEFFTFTEFKNRETGMEDNIAFIVVSAQGH